MEQNAGVRYIAVRPDEMRSRFYAALLKSGLTEERSLQCAEIFTSNSVDGIYTHGVNRFAKFVDYIEKGFIKKDASPSIIKSIGGIEQWDGNYGAGVLNAVHSTNRAIDLSDKYGIGAVALANTNHWMRGGYYGWHAARKGYALIAWTNSIASMPAWNALDNKLGNDPLVIAVPFGGEAIVLDMALSQFSYGAMEIARMKGDKLPVPGGFDTDGNISDDPAAILASGHALPIGYWKGAGLALLLDILATVLSGGLSTMAITHTQVEYATQVFVCVNINKLGDRSSIASVIRAIIDDYLGSPAIEGKRILYPGQRVLETRQRNERLGIPVEENIWKGILAL